MSGCVTSEDIGIELTALLQIPRLRDVTINFPLHGCISADVNFLLDEVQARAIVNLCRDGKWRSPRDE